MPKVSIIMPVYNAKKYLKKSIDSILNQTFRDFELIIINDGSKDNSEDIIKSYNDSRIIYIKKDNGGPASARNVGLDIVRGDYIGFVDSDDYIDVTMYEKMYNKIVSSCADIVVCDYYIVKNDNITVKKISNQSDFNVSVKENPKLLSIAEPAPWNKLYNKKLFDKRRFPVGLKYEDCGLIPIILHLANKITKIDEPLYYYIENAAGETATINDKIFDIFDIFQILYNYFKNTNTIEELENMIVKKAIIYNVRACYLSDKKKRKIFLQRTHVFLDSNFPNWKKNKNYNNPKAKFYNLVTKNRVIFYLYKILLKK